MNLNELFFFKVFPCSKNTNNKFIDTNSHNEKNCYFYHLSPSYENGVMKNVENDRRREPLSFRKFFKNLLNKIKDDENYSLSAETLFELKNDENNLEYYIDSMQFEYLNESIYLNIDCCQNETEFNYHMNRYQNNFCRFFKIYKKCKNKFCYSKHATPPELNNNDNSINEGIMKYRETINEWKQAKEIKFKEIIELFGYILSFENNYISREIQDEIKENFEIFKNWYQDIKESAQNKNKNSNGEIPSYINYRVVEKYQKNDEAQLNNSIINNIYKSIRLVNESSKINTTGNLLDTLKIKTGVCYFSKYTSIKKNEIVKYVYAMLNSSDGVIIYGGHENNNCIKGICLNRKERDKFKIWFNSEFIKILIKYEGNLKYKFYDLDNGNNDECVLVIEIKKLKSHKFLIRYPDKYLIIKERFLNRNKGEKNKLLNEENVKELDLREYLELLRKKLLEHYCQKFKMKIN